MGKALSKAGMRLNTRRQRSQMISQHQGRLAHQKPLGNMETPPTESGSVLPHELASGITIHTLKIQKDEFSIVRGNLNRITLKEMEVLKQLLLDGKRDLAQVLLKKKRFQEHILEEAETELNYVLSKTTNPDRYKGVKAEADNCVNRNSETLKRIQMLLSVPDIERILLEEESQGKMEQVNRILLLASVGERKKFDHELDDELDSIIETIDIALEEQAKDEDARDEEDAYAAELEERNLIDLEDYVKNDHVRKTVENVPVDVEPETDVIPVASADLGLGSPIEESKVESAAEETEGGTSGLDGDDEKSVYGSNHGSASDVNSKMFPEVPESSIHEDIGVVSESLPLAEPETA